jgi:hypothetical protein
MRVLLAAAGIVLGLAARPAAAVDFRWGLLGGYNHGIGARGEVVALHFARNVPLGVSFGLGYTSLDPGKPAAARRVFINDATDGTPEESGYFLDFKLDAIWYLKLPRFQHAGVFAGVRHDRFRGRFRYVGGNEDFTIEANDWGFGLGARGELRLFRGVNLLGSFGLDLYPVSTLYGHDSTYASNGGEGSGRDGYGWEDADKAVNQPRLVPSLMLGVAF